MPIRDFEIAHFTGAPSRPLIGDGLTSSSRIPRQLPAIRFFVFVELARHANDRGFVVANIFPTVINTGRNYDQPLITFAQHKLVDAAEGRRAAPAVIADYAKRSCRREQAIDGETMDSPRPEFFLET
jgi:hypothetical protein